MNESTVLPNMEPIQNSIFKIQYSAPRGFTLLELLIVIAIMALLGGAGAGFYRNIIKNVEIQSVAKVLASDLRQMRSNSMIGASGLKWGAHIVNTSGAGSKQYYELFSTASNYAAGTVTATTTLSLGVTFTTPSAGNSIDVIFSKISGTTTAQSIVLSSEGQTQTLNVTNIGTIN